MPNVHVYTMVHNEELLLPYFMRHYNTVASKIVVFDNESTDKTAEIARAMGAEVRPFAGQYSDRHLLWTKNEAYKESRGKADWIIAVDGDELIWHPELPKVLDQYTAAGVTLPLVGGYDMISDAPPSGTGQIYEEIKSGIRCHWYCKRAVFHPSIDINFGIGSHECRPVGRVVSSKTEDLKLLHYRLLGVEFLIGRWRERVNRQTQEQVQNKWSPIVSLDPAVTKAWIEKYKTSYPPVQVLP